MRQSLRGPERFPALGESPGCGDPRDRWAPGWGSPRRREGGFDVPKCEVLQRGCVDSVPTPGVPITRGCPPCPCGTPVPGCPSQGCPFWGYAQPREKKKTKKQTSQGMSRMMNSHPGGVPTPVAGLSQNDARSGGMPIPEDANRSHARRIPANHGAAPHLCHSLSLVVVRPHAWMWGCLWGHFCPLWPLPW